MLSLVYFFDQINGSSLGFVEYPGKIFPQDPEADELHASEEKHANDYGSKTWDRVAQIFLDDHVNGVPGAEYGSKVAKPGGQFKGDR